MVVPRVTQMPLGGTSASRDPITSPCELLLFPEPLENCGPILPKAVKKKYTGARTFSGDIPCKAELSLRNFLLIPTLIS